jgi:hypothetical protein
VTQPEGVFYLNAIENYRPFTASIAPVPKVQGKPKLGEKPPVDDDDTGLVAKKAPKKFEADLLASSFSTEAILGSGSVGTVGSAGPGKAIKALACSAA